MIIDARKASSPKNGRPYTVSTAVADVIDGIDVGSSMTVDAIKDAVGRDVAMPRLNMLISKHKGRRVFVTRTIKDTGAVVVHRIA